jgi:hypothetical protein
MIITLRQKVIEIVWKYFCETTTTKLTNVKINQWKQNNHNNKINNNKNITKRRPNTKTLPTRLSKVFAF